MKRRINIVAAICALICIVGCDDILEEDISNDTMVIVSPLDQSTINGNSAQFRWEELDGATDYRIEVIKNDNQSTALDSIVYGNSFAFSLDPGSYNWRIRGENFAYVTAFSAPASFSMVASDDLSIQNVFLTSPSEDFYTNRSSILLNWTGIQAASAYTLEIDKTIQGNTITETQIADITDTNYTLPASILSEDGIYTWKVKATNATSETGFSSRKIFRDTQSPNQPVLSAPNEDATVTSTVLFSWALSTDSGEVQSPVSSVFEIASDANFVSIIQTYDTNTTSQEHTFATVGTYYWRVKGVDQSGNESVFSSVRKLTVQ